jgi:hypothetical protein
MEMFVARHMKRAVLCAPAAAAAAACFVGARRQREGRALQQTGRGGLGVGSRASRLCIHKQQKLPLF